MYPSASIPFTTAFLFPLLGSISISLFALGTSAFAADTQLVFPSDKVDEAFQGAAATYDSFALNKPEYLAYRQSFIYLYQRNPKIPRERAIELFETWRNRFIEKYQPGDP